MIQDLRYALRVLLKSPGFTLAAVLTLVLGIGATTTVFSLVSAVLLRPLPYQDADRLVSLWGTQGADRQVLTAYADLMDVRAQSGDFDAIGVVRGLSVNLTGREAPERLVGEFVTADVFGVYGARAALGRTFTPDETAPGGGRDVAVLSDAAWKARFGGDPRILGRSLILNGRPNVVIGVMPPGFVSPFGPTEVWLPITSIPSAATIFDRGVQNVWGVGRLKPGVSVEQAQRQLDVIAARLAAAYPATNAGFGVRLIGLRENVVGSVRPALLTLLGAVLVVLLIACANVAGLQLARTAARRQEMSVRAALGAGRARLARQLVTESGLLALAGGAGGVLLAGWSVGALARSVPGGLPAFGAIGVDRPALLFAVATVAVSALVFGLAPAVIASRADLGDALRVRAPDAGAAGRLRRGLVVAELALAMVLIASAGLLVRSVAALSAVDPGFAPDHLLTFQFRLPRTKYADSSRMVAFFEQTADRVRAVPGVRAAALVTLTPMTGNWATTRYEVEGRPAPAPGQAPEAGINAATPGYFATLDIPVSAGRDFDARDRLGSLPVAIVSRELARREWPGSSALGRRIRQDGDPVWRTVVGVVGDTKQLTLGEEVQPRIYVPLLQAPGAFCNVVARTAGDPLAAVAAVRAALWSVDPEQPVWSIASMDQLLARATWQSRFTTWLTGVFAALALLLAAIGVYGVTAYAVVQRTREVGIRLAVGATPAEAVRLLLGDGLRLALVATALGVGGAFAATRLLRGELYGVGATDPVAFGAGVLVLAGAAMLATWLPARRAARVDPVVALRNE